MISTLILAFFSIGIITVISNNCYVLADSTISLSPLTIADNMNPNGLPYQTIINENEISNITVENLNKQIDGFSIDKITQSNEWYYCKHEPLTTAGPGGEIELHKIDCQNYFFSNIDHDKALKNDFEKVLNIKLNETQPVDLHSKIKINPDKYADITPCIFYKVFTIQMSKKTLFNKPIFVNCTIAVASEIGFDVSEH